MARLPEMLPDAEVILAMPPEELGLYVLTAVREEIKKQFPANNNMLTLQSIINGLDVPLGTNLAGFDMRHRNRVAQAVTEAWSWLEGQQYLVPAAGINGANGWRTISRRGEEILATGPDWKQVQAASKFPRELLHPMIAEKAYTAVLRGEYDVAALRAFRTVEEEVRAAGKFADSDIGVNLMRKAFDVNSGRLTDLTQPAAERQALSDLFAGAIGSYKNPHSHRTVQIRDLVEGQDIVMLASHLMRIVDSRRHLVP